MAKKGGSMQFNSQAAKSKWALLEHQADQSLENVVAGKASVADVQKVSTALQSMSAVAHQVFNEAVDAATALVKSTADASSGSTDLTKASGDRQLTDFEKALNQALKPTLQELLHQIEDAIVLDSLMQTDEIEKKMGQSFADLASIMPPRDLPTVNDMLANNELLDEQNQQVLNKQEDSILDRMYGMMKDIMSNLKVRIPADALALQGGGSNYVKGRRHQMNPYEIRTFADRAKDFIDSEEGRASISEAVEADSQSNPALSGISSLKEGTTETPGQSLESQRMTSILDRLETFLDGRESDAQESNTDKDKKESETADTWWRSFNRNVKGGISKTTSKAKGFLADILGEIGKIGLLASIFDPNMWTTLANDIQTYITWDNLKKAASDGWTWLEDKTSGIVDWILDKLHLGGAKSSTKLTPAAQAQFDQLSATDQLQATGGPSTQAAYIMKFMENGKLNAKGQELLAAASPETKKAFETMKYDNETLVQRVGRGWSDVVNIFSGKETSRDAQQRAIQQASTSIAPGTPSGSSRSTVGGSPTPESGTSTSVALNKMRNAAATTVNNSPALSATQSGIDVAGAARKATVGTAAVGINSFGFTQGTSDNLLLMNSSILGH